MPGTPLSLPEREEIGVALIEDREMPWAQIAGRVGRHPTMIAREVNVNGGRRSYRPAVASQRALTQRMGHSAITVTYDTDGHLFPARDAEITAALEALGIAARASRER